MSTLTDTMGISADRAIRIENLRKTYRAGRERRTVLSDFNMEVKQGEWLALLGPHGCGKTTLLRICSALEAPDFGLVEIAGQNVSTHPTSVRSRIGMVFEKPALDPLLSVGDNLLLQGSLFHLPKSGNVMRIQALTEQLELTGLLKDRLGSLPVEMIRRVDLARALMSEPSVLLLDEPTTGLDHRARLEFLELLDSLRNERPELAIVMSTEFLDEAECADTLALLNKGTIITSGPPDALREQLAAQVVKTTPDFEHVLRDAGLSTRSTSTEVDGVGHAAHVNEACEALLEQGAAFSVGPATMSDVFHSQSAAETEPASMTSVEEAA